MTVPSWQETFLHLHEAPTPEELWTVLLVPHGIRSSSAWEEPYLLFRSFHLEDPTDAATTALLLCTDYRWRKATHHLIHELDKSGLLDEHALDLLATWFLATDLDVKVPRRLFCRSARRVHPVGFERGDRHRRSPTTGDGSCACRPSAR